MAGGGSVPDDGSRGDSCFTIKDKINQKLNRESAEEVANDYADVLHSINYHYESIL